MASVIPKLQEELDRMVARHDELAEGVPCSGANELLWEIKGFAKAKDIVYSHELTEIIDEAHAAIEKASRSLLGASTHEDILAYITRHLNELDLTRVTSMNIEFTYTPTQPTTMIKFTLPELGRP